MNYYILEGRRVTTTPCMFCAEQSQRRIAVTKVGSLQVSTVLLPVDHSFGIDELPIVWETMVFDKGESVDMNRCGGSIEQAEEMHARMVEKARARIES